MQVRFGTDGVRGVYGHHPCTPGVANRFGAALVRFSLSMGDGLGRVVIGTDTRPSQRQLTQALTNGVTTAGGKALSLGVLPTAGVSVAIEQGMAPVGVMITASHNPSQDNGFKVFGKGGRKLTNEENCQFEAWLNGASLNASVVGQNEDVSEQALKAYFKALDAALPRTPGELRIGFDLANGAATGSRSWIAKRLGENAFFHQAPSATINEGCGSEHPAGLAKFVVDKGLDMGVALDGDGDRTLLIDSTGRVIPGDALAWLLTRGLGYKKLAVTVMSNGALEANLPEVNVVRTDVGDRHLAAAMVKHDIPLGCEESGHVLFSDGLPTGDGLLTAWRALCIAEDGGGLSNALRTFALLPRQTEAVVVHSRPPFDQIPGLDGLRSELLASLGEGGRIFLRYSGTQDRLRVLVEGTDSGAVTAVTKALADTIRRAIGDAGNN
jgi:phosphoglucosamine mutase